ncbi:MAG: hypothetical protein ACJ8BC_03040 [Gemmatimonadales bacterium]
MRVKAFVAAGIMGLALLAAGVLPAAGEDSAMRVTLRYAVKFVCGDPGGGGQPVPDVQLPLTRGRYHTAINVHNPALHKKSGQKSDSAVTKDFLVSFWRFFEIKKSRFEHKKHRQGTLFVQSRVRLNHALFARKATTARL